MKDYVKTDNLSFKSRENGSGLTVEGPSGVIRVQRDFSTKCKNLESDWDNFYSPVPEVTNFRK